MKKILTFLFTIISFTVFSQGITVTVGDKVGKSFNSDSLGGKMPDFYVDTLSNQNISGTKTFNGNIIIGNNILPDSTRKRSLGSQSFRIKKLWIGGGSIDMDGRLIYLNAVDKGIEFEGRIHVMDENDTAGSICFHPNKYMPLVSTEGGYRIWADSATNNPKWLLPNADTSIKINYGFVMEDTSGNVQIAGDLKSSSITINGEITGGGCYSVADDASITLPDATTQSLVVYVDGDDEWALAAIQADGTVNLPATFGSVTSTDTDGNLVINALGAGTLVSIKNRLGSTKTICYTTKYKE